MVAVLEREFFLTEILGRKVFLRTERVGKLAEIVMLETGKFPEVTHVLVDRPFGYSTLVVPWNKVSLISNTEIVIDDDSSSAFEQPVPSGSILLKDHILDKKILDLDGREIEVVYDVKLALQNDRLYATEVDFSRYRLLRRMGFKALARWMAEQRKASTVSWIYVQPLPQHLGTFSGHVKLNVLKENIHDIHPVDLADILEELDGSQRLALFNELEPGHASETLEEVEPRVQRELIGAMGKERAAELINEMSPPQAADVLAALPADEVDELLPLIDQESAPTVQQIIEQHDENIMLFLTDEFIRMRPMTTVNEVMTNYRELARDKEVIMYVYVVDDQHTLAGVVDLRELLAARPEQSLAEIMTDKLMTLDPGQSLNDAVEMFGRYGFRAIPVTDRHDQLLGVVSYRHIRGIKPRLH